MNAKERSTSVVVCRVGHEPEIVPVTRSFDYSHVKTLVKRADLPLSYPKYLAGGLPRGLSVCCDDSAALKRLPVNRWGIIGDFIVCRTFSASNRGLEQADAEKIVRHLTEEYGYLRSDSGVQNITHGGCRILGAARAGTAPVGTERTGVRS